MGEELSMRWMDRTSVTEMEKGGVYEMDIRKSAKKHGNAIWTKTLKKKIMDILISNLFF